MVIVNVQSNPFEKKIHPLSYLPPGPHLTSPSLLFQEKKHAVFHRYAFLISTPSPLSIFSTFPTVMAHTTPENITSDMFALGKELGSGV